MNTVLSQVNLKIGLKRTILVQDYEVHQSEFVVSREVYNTHLPSNIIDHRKQTNQIEQCFATWRQYVHDEKNKKESELKQNEKLEVFLTTLKRIQEKSIDENNENRLKKYRKRCDSHISHRFEAQKEIIQMQKEKLREQQNMIEQLKLGNFETAINESMKQAKKTVTEIFQNCSVRLKCKIKSNVFLENINQDLLALGIKSDKVPRIIREMEQRALERQQKRQLISERKKIIDFNRKKAVQNEIMERKSQDEEQRRKAMEDLHKRREAQLKFYKQVKLKREKMLQDNAKADDFYVRNLKKNTFVVLQGLVQIKHENFIRSKVHYENRLQRKSIKYWKHFLAEVEYRRNYKAVQMYKWKIKRKLFLGWVKVSIGILQYCSVFLQLYTLSIQHKQVAEDFYTMLLERTFFNQWHRYTCTQIFLDMKNTQKALNHYQNWMIFHYFYQWRSLPAVLIIERAKEEKKRKWREKVWEILPDYKPVMDNSF